MNFSDRLRRLGTLVKIQFPLETVPKKRVKNFSHQAAYNNDILKRVHIKSPSDFRFSCTELPFFLSIFMRLSVLYLKISEYDVHS